MPTHHEGGCVCGAVRYVVEGAPERVSLCHCAWCQKRTGTAFGTEVVFPENAVRFTRGAPKIYRHLSDESGRWLDQHFCGECGANLGLTLEAVPGIRSIPAGTFDDPGWITPQAQTFRAIFLRSARDWSEVPAGIERHELHFRR